MGVLVLNLRVCFQLVDCLVCVQDHVKHCIALKFSSLNSCRTFGLLFPFNLQTASIFQDHIIKNLNFKILFVEYLQIFFCNLVINLSGSLLTHWMLRLCLGSYHQQSDIVSFCLYSCRLVGRFNGVLVINLRGSFTWWLLGLCSGS